jgi:hypothetical protein
MIVSIDWLIASFSASWSSGEEVGKERGRNRDKILIRSVKSSTLELEIEFESISF